MLHRTNGRLRMVALAIAAVTTGTAVADHTATAAEKSGIDVQYIDHTVRPQDDFYGYVNGGWLKSHPFPLDAVRISAAFIINDATQIQLRKIVEDAAYQSSTPPDPDKRKLALLYSSFMDANTAERTGLAPLRARLAAINSIGSSPELAQRMGELGCIGVQVPGWFTTEDQQRFDALTRVWLRNMRHLRRYLDTASMASEP